MATLTALTFAGAAGLCAQNSTTLRASADTETGEIVTPTSAQLISPSSYQQYLSLTAPTDVAVTDKYTAIADGNVIHIYDGDIGGDSAGVYHAYTHSNDVSSLAFDADNNLYFLSEFVLYRLSSDSLHFDNGAPVAESVGNIICSNFTIHGDTLYYYAMSKTLIKSYSLTNQSFNKDITLSTPLQDNSPLFFGVEGLYYVSNVNEEYTVHAVNPTDGSSNAIAAFSKALSSITVANHLFCATTRDGAFYTYNYNDLRAHKNADLVAPVTDTSLDDTTAKGYGVARTYNHSVYVIRGNALYRYSASNAAFENFEITASSASVNRLNSANDVFLAENRLFIADNGNDRISVYNTETEQFEGAIPTQLDLPFLAAYKDTVLVSSTQEATLYSLAPSKYGQAILTLSNEEVDGDVIDVACVYDRYYVLTNTNYCYTLSANENGWSYNETQKITLGGMRPSAFAADVYGSLYVVYDSGEVYRFTERELLSVSATGTRILDNVKDVEKLAVDYNRSLYTLTNNQITRYDEPTEADKPYTVGNVFTPSYDLVKDETPNLVSFAFGVETNEAYLLYADSYAIQTTELDVPIVSPIPVGDAVERIFGAANRDFSVVTVQEDAILTEFDVNALQDAELFPYVAFERCSTPFTALKIGEEGEYSILAVAKETVGYKTYLVTTVTCEAVTDYYAPAKTEQTGYLTNDVALYKFPYLNERLTVAEITRGSYVTILGEVKKLNRDYYEIAYQTENGERVTGFIPTAYVNAFNGADPLLQVETYGETEDDHDSVGRFIYLLLGFGAIAILVDFLLLKKPKSEEN